MNSVSSKVMTVWYGGGVYAGKIDLFFIYVKIKMMKCPFSYEDITNVVRGRVNSPDEARSRNGEYVIPFVSELPPEERVHELYGHLLQERHRLKNLRWIETDLQKALLKWHNFYVKKRFANSFLTNAKPDLEKLWKGFLDYSGNKKNYRMRLEKSNREVLQHQLRIKVDWTKEEGGEFPISKVNTKLKSISNAIAQTRKDILETESRLQVAQVLFYQQYMPPDCSGEEHILESACRAQLNSIFQKVQEELQHGRKNPQDES